MRINTAKQPSAFGTAYMSHTHMHTAAREPSSSHDSSVSHILATGTE
jgi:hypothetical protein